MDRTSPLSLDSCRDQGRNMSCFQQSVKTKGIWILLFCGLVSLFCIAYHMNKLKLVTPNEFNEIVADKNAVVEFAMIKSRHNKTGISNIGKNNVKDKKSSRETFRGRSNASSVPAMKRKDSKFSNVTRFTNDSKPSNVSVNTDNNKTGLSHSSDIKVGVLIPSSTRKIKKPALETLSLTKICIPSIYKTIETGYTYVIYVGIDKGDYLETARDKLEAMFDNVKAVVTISRTFTKTVNAIARQAYQDGMDYLVRINDDSSFESQSWTSKGISVLKSYSPPNIGVVGPTCHQGNTEILTHDMVHRTHLDIFDFYYPPYFDNWWADDWITQVYKPKRSTKLPSWLMKHHLSSHGTRYNVDGKQHNRLDKTLTFDRERLTKYLSTDKQ